MGGGGGGGGGRVGDIRSRMRGEQGGEVGVMGSRRVS